MLFFLLPNRCLSDLPKIPNQLDELDIELHLPHLTLCLATAIHNSNG